MIPYENSLNKKLLDGNSEIHLLPWIRSRYFKSTRKDKIDISTSTIFLIRIHSHDFQLYLLLIALSVSRIAKCFQWNVTLQKSPPALCLRPIDGKNLFFLGWPYKLPTAVFRVTKWMSLPMFKKFYKWVTFTNFLNLKF